MGEEKEGGRGGLADKFTYNDTGGGGASEDRQGNEYGHKLEGSHCAVSGQRKTGKKDNAMHATTTTTTTTTKRLHW